LADSAPVRKLLNYVLLVAITRMYPVRASIIVFSSGTT
jgi:hypothetical protein